jgi:hypothetical protein
MNEQMREYRLKNPERIKEYNLKNKEDYLKRKRINHELLAL